MRDWIALQLIKAARRFTTWGDVDDMLDRAQLAQHWAVHGQCGHMGNSRCGNCEM